MKHMKNTMKYGATLALAAVGSVANAVVPTGVDTAITEAQTDAVTVGGFIIVALSALVAIRWIIKSVRGA